MSSICTSPSVFSVQDAAMIKIAASIWSHRISYSTNIDELVKPSPAENTIPLPNLLKRRLHHCMQIMAGEIVRWIMDHFTIIFDKPTSYFLPCLRHLVWLPDGTIHYVATAEKLLRESCLTEIEKFEMAKLYFFKDFINETWPQISENTIKGDTKPEEVFSMMLKMCRPTSGYQHLKIHKRMKDFLEWYYQNSKRRIIDFTFPRLQRYKDTKEEALVRVLLLGLGYGVPLPAGI